MERIARISDGEHAIEITADGDNGLIVIVNTGDATRWNCEEIAEVIRELQSADEWLRCRIAAADATE